jgi:hypothetical protein
MALASPAGIEFQEIMARITERAGLEARLLTEHGFLITTLGDDGDTYFTMGHVDKDRFRAQLRELAAGAWGLTTAEAGELAPDDDDIVHGYFTSEVEDDEVRYHLGAQASTPGAEPCTLYFS